MFIVDLFNVVLYEPILNFLIWLYDYIGSFGVAVIILTLIIRACLIPLNAKALKSQKEMQEIQPLIKKIQKEYKDNKEKQAEEMMKIYKEKGFNPFASFWNLLIQIPIILALYQVIRNTASGVEMTALYSFVPDPGTINFMFLGIDLANPNWILAIIVAIFQFIQINSMQPKTEESKDPDQMEKMQKMMQTQMKFMFPVLTLIILINLPAALGIYWLIITIITTIQQKLILNK
jgi:YidC/Oxa1 family membrane protein insertase